MSTFRNGELASIIIACSDSSISWQRYLMNLDEAAGVWWYMLRMVAIFCSSSPFFATPVEAMF